MISAAAPISTSNPAPAPAAPPARVPMDHVLLGHVLSIRATCALVDSQWARLAMDVQDLTAALHRFPHGDRPELDQFALAAARFLRAAHGAAEIALAADALIRSLDDRNHKPEETAPHGYQTR